MSDASDAGVPIRLEGRWRLDRHIDDRRAGGVAAFAGEALFRPDGSGLRCEEAGLLRINGVETRASRVYLWRFPAPERVEVLFEDGRFFHAFDPRDPAPGASHDCPPDFYEVTYRFDGPDRWRSVWRVRGPRKDYRMESVFSRLAQSVPVAPQRALVP